MTAKNEWTRRSVLGAAAAALTVPALAIAQEKAAAKAPAKVPVEKVAAEKPAPLAAAAAKGKLTDESLGTLLKAMGIEAKLNEKRYDFAFKSTVADQDWELSMSAVLSLDGSSIWVMAWLDELPKSAADVPRTALLRLLSENDKMGKGKFFAYIASNRRFVLQRVVPNENMSTAAFRAALDDVGATVVQTYPFWSVANWNGASTQPAEEATAKSSAPVKGSAPQGPASQKVIKQAVRDTNFEGTTRK